MAERLVSGRQENLPGLGQTFAPARRTSRSRKKPAKVVSEYTLHKTIAELLDWVLLPPTVWTTIPSGWGKLPPATAGRLQACGLKRGMPDTLIFARSGVFGIELKADKGRISIYQHEMAHRLLAVGVRVYIASSVDDVMDILRRENIAVRSFT